MKFFFYRMFRALQYLKLSKHPGAIKILSRFPKLDLSLLEAREGGARVFLKGTDVEVTAGGLQFLLRGLDCVGRLIRESDAAFKSQSEGVLLEVQGVKLRLDNWEELFIAKEVFAESTYNLKIGKPFVLVDVGMNVGTTSLFFANKDSCQAIYAFELFPKTVEKARINFSLNPAIAKKINVTTKGLASHPFTAQMDYSEEYRGSAGLMGLPDYVKSDPQSAKVEKVQVECISCAEAFAEILKHNGDAILVCKLDCEGAEYEILETLAQSGLLKRISFLLIEWHRKGAASIETILQQNGFDFLSFSPNAPTHSMIYGWRQTDSLR